MPPHDIGKHKGRKRRKWRDGAAQPGAVVESPVGLIDVYPTLGELCGVSAPENLQGQSLVPMLKDASVTGRGWALSQVTRGGGAGAKKPGFFGYSLRTPRWRYTEWDEGETAMGEGTDLPDATRWGWYFGFGLTCDCAEAYEGCETAFSYDGTGLTDSFSGVLSGKPLDDLVGFFPPPRIDDVDARFPVALLLGRAAEPPVEDDGDSVSPGSSVAGQQVNQGLAPGLQALALMQAQDVRLSDEIVAVNDDVHNKLAQG